MNYVALNQEPQVMDVAALEGGVLLIVDDNPTNLEVLCDFLDEAGFEILVAQDGESAIAKVAISKPDLILLDVMMPVLDGFETCDRLKQDANTRNIPIIFMTALTDPVDKVRGLSLGAVDYVTKPLQQDEVLARVRTHLRLSNLTKILEIQNSLLKQEVTERLAAEDALQTLTMELEHRIQERTLALSQALQDLQKTQIQLVQTEKMSSIGQLVAVVAHEINNPVGFITGNLSFAEEYVSDLFELLNLYQTHYPNPIAAIANKIKAMDLEYVMADLLKILSSMTIGADCIRQISQSLRTFSRADASIKVPFDIHEGLNSTLMLLKYRLKTHTSTIEITTEYGELPLIRCYPGQLNQVFMNILANAIDAVEESILRDFNLIQIKTEVTDSNSIIIRIKDNGSGMPANVKDRIFNYLFTTKPAGKGTGLGLSISHQIIVQNHGGQLSCNSVVGEGTEFIIELPV